MHGELRLRNNASFQALALFGTLPLKNLTVVCIASIAQYKLSDTTIANIYISVALTFISILVVRSGKLTLSIGFLDVAFWVYIVYVLTKKYLFDGNYVLNNERTVYLGLSAVTFAIIRTWHTSSLRETTGLFTRSVTFSAIIEVLFCILQAVQILPSLNPLFSFTGSFSNTGPLAIFCATSLCIFSFKLSAHERQRLFFILATTSLVVLILITRSRTAIMGLVIIGSTSFFLNARKTTLRHGRVYLSFIFLTFFSALLWGLFKYKELSSYTRVLSAKISYLYISDYLFFGSGYDTFRQINSFYQIEYFSTTAATSLEKQIARTVSYAFNDFIQLTCETGIIGLAMFLMLIFAYIFTFKNGKIQFRSLCLAVAIILISALTSYPFEVSSIWWMFVVSLALSSSSRPFLVIELTRLRLMIFCISLFLISLFTFSSQLRLLRAEYDWISASNDFDRGNYNSAEIKLKNSESLFSKEASFGQLYSNCLFKQGKLRESIKIADKALKYGVTESFLLDVAIQRYQAGDTAAAIHYLKKCTLLVPSNESANKVMQKLQEYRPLVE